jgi:hypothetical protein
MSDYPGSVSFDVRITCTPDDLPGIVQVVEELPEGFPTILGVEFPSSPIVFGGSPLDEELQDAFERRCD